MYNQDDIVYKLVVEDVQTVATEILGRDLSDEEIKSIKDLIAEKIPWFDAISDAIGERFGEEQREFRA